MKKMILGLAIIIGSLSSSTGWGEEPSAASTASAAPRVKTTCPKVNESGRGTVLPAATTPATTTPTSGPQTKK